MKRRVFYPACLLVLGMVFAAQGQEPQPAIKSRTMGEVLSTVERACRINLAAYCTMHGVKMLSDVHYKVEKKGSQFDVTCNAVCRPAKD